MGTHRLSLRTLGTAVLMFSFAFAFQGTRGLWEPDEGFYANAALGMLDTGDFVVPQLNGAPFLDKPPLVYWIQALGVWLCGRSEWGLRFGHAVLFAATALLAGAVAGRMKSHGSGIGASWLYATLPLAYLAGNILTPDTPLAFGLALALYGLIRLETSPTGENCGAGWLLVGLGFALALLAKGPVALPFALVPLLHRLIGGRLAKTLREGWAWIGVLVALLPAFVWYGTVALSLSGAGDYLLDQQVVGRVLTTHLERNPGWGGALRVYLPTLLIGLAPWGAKAFRRLWTILATACRRHPAGASPAGAELLLVLWVLVPLATFVAAQSRLPLYLLPLAFPTAVLAQLGLAARGPAPASRRPLFIGAVVVATGLLAIKAGAAYVGSYRDTREVAKDLSNVLPESVHRVITVDVNRNGLSLYRAGGVEWVTKDPTPYPLYSPLESWEVELSELAACPRLHALIVSWSDVQELQTTLQRAGQHCVLESFPAHNPILLCQVIEPPVAPTTEH